MESSQDRDRTHVPCIKGRFLTTGPQRSPRAALSLAAAAVVWTVSVGQPARLLLLYGFSVPFSCSVVSNPLQPHGLQHEGLLVHHQLLELLKLMSIELVTPSSHLILCPLLLLPSIFPSIRVFANESAHQVAKGLELQLQHQSFQ